MKFSLNNKNIIYLGAFLVIALIAGGVVVSKYILPDAASQANAPLAGIVDIKSRPIKSLNAKLLQDQRFIGLKDNTITLSGVGDIKVGKKNPFE